MTDKPSRCYTCDHAYATLQHRSGAHFCDNCAERYQIAQPPPQNDRPLRYDISDDGSLTYSTGWP
jgi:hypothetical protein